MNHTVYMDHNATTPLRPSVRDVMVAALDAGGNPSSVHAVGRAARQRIEEARERVRALVNAPMDARVIFTSGGTEANVLVLRGCGCDKVFAPRTEHPSVLTVPKTFTDIPVDGDGCINLVELHQMLTGGGWGGDDILVSVMLANNETGVVQPVADSTACAHRHGALVHTDAVQAAGKVDVDFQALGVDYLTLSAHKIGGPQGMGALIVRAAAPLQAVQRGGGQEGGMRGGTENVAGIAGFGAAAQAAQADLGHMKTVQALRDHLEARILEIAPEAKIIAAGATRLPNTSLLALPGLLGETQVMAFDLAGICISAGSACASGSVKASGVLSAMGVPDDIAESVVRVSLGQANTSADIESFISVWKHLYVRESEKRNAA